MSQRDELDRITGYAMIIAVVIAVAMAALQVFEWPIPDGLLAVGWMMVGYCIGVAATSSC